MMFAPILIDEDDNPPLTDEDRSWCSFRPARRDPTPTVRVADCVRSTIDAFVPARLKKQDL